MVEREAQLDRERPLVSAVIYNRLKEGMTLGIDATIRYYENNWSRPLRVSELERDSPYNTRLNRGLPPTPIGNPGLASIKAAANPARGKDYLFYVRKPGDSRRARVLVHRRAVPARRREVPGLARAADAPAGRVRLAGRPLALAGDARGGAGGGRPGGLELPEAAAPAGAVRRDGARAPRGGLPRGQRDDPAQGGGARAGRHARATPRARSAPRTRSRSSATAPSTPTTPTPRG